MSSVSQYGADRAGAGAVGDAMVCLVLSGSDLGWRRLEREILKAAVYESSLRAWL
jgi:hypothetical protein